MRLCRFNADRFGVVQGDLVHDVTPVLDLLPAFRVPLPKHDPVIAALPELLPAIRAALPGAPSLPLAAVTLLPPVGNPGKIVAAPVNYKKHLDEAQGMAELHHGNQVNEIQRTGLFLKSGHSLVAPAHGVHLRFPDRRTDHEVELAAIIGTRGSNIARADALRHIAGYCIGLDMTLRGPEERSFRKSIDSYTVLGPWMVTADEFGDPGDVALELDVNGAPRQRARTRDLLLDVPALIAFASAFYTLEPGDVLLTGTPEGVAQVHPGDRIRASIERLGEIRVAVSAA